MAGVSRDLTLVDKFSSVFDKFIHRAEKAEQAVEKIEESVSAAERVTDEATGAVYRWTNVIGHFNKGALLATESFQELVDKGYLVEVVAAKTKDLDEKTEDLGDTIEDTGDEFEESGEKAAKSIDKVEKKTSKLGRTLTRLGVILFGLRKIVQAVKNAMARVPDEIMKPFSKLKSLLEDDLARVTTSLFKGMQSGLERLNQAFESPAGRKFIAALQVGFEALGEIIGSIAGIVADFMDMLFTNLEKTEINFTNVGEVIGKVVGAVYVVVNNAVATLWNLAASFAEFLGNAFTDPLGSVVRLVVDVVNIIVDVVSWAARQLDKLLGTNIAGAITSFQDDINNWVEEKVGPKKFELERMEYIDFADTMDRFGLKGAEYGGRIEKAFRGSEALNSIKASSAQTAGNTKAIKDAISDEDLKMLIDVATQKFVSNVNLTAQTPVITINGANTGNTEADRRALVNDIKYILVEQLASGSTSGQYAFAGN